MRQEDMASGFSRGGLGWMLGKISSPKALSVIVTAAQGSSWVTISGGISKTSRCGSLVVDKQYSVNDWTQWS